MKTHRVSIWSKTIFSIIAFALFIVVLIFYSQRSSATDCCIPPLGAQAKFPQGAQVTVYVPPNSGLSPEEVTAIKQGLEDWNDENNNSGVDYTVVEGEPPPQFTNNTIVVNFHNNADPNSGGGALTMQNGTNSSGPFVFGTYHVWTNHRTGTLAQQLQRLRVTSRHEGGHGIGLANANPQNCPWGSTIMLPIDFPETFITDCDNAKINEQAIYGGTPTPTPTPTPEPSPTPCAELGQGCYYFYGDCCAGLVCGEITLSCIQCQPNPTNHEVCMSQRCSGCYNNGGTNCTGDGYDCWTPIVVDVAGNGFNLTDATNGVNFNNGMGNLLRTAWTTANSDDAWLVLDRNGNGAIDNATELFGNAAPQPPTDGLYNGFRALAEYDKFVQGGNDDGEIDMFDSIFISLRLWQDVNHDGISTANELLTLTSAGIASIDLDYKESKHKDSNNNTFKYRSKIKNSHGGQATKWIYDVFLDARPAQ